MNDDQTHGLKIRETTIRVKGHEYPRIVVDFGTVDGKRQRRFFKTRLAVDRAVAVWQQEQKILSRRIGESAKRFLPGDVQDAASAMTIIGRNSTLSEAANVFKTVRDANLDLATISDAAAGVRILNSRATLEEAAKFYIARHYPEGGERTVDALVEDYIESRRQVDRRPATLRDIRGNLGRGQSADIERQGGGTLRLGPTGFAHHFAGVPVAHVTTSDLERWMERHKAKAKATRRNIRVHLVGLFNFAKARKYVTENPAEPLMTPKTAKNSKGLPYVMPVEDVEKVLKTASAMAPETVPFFALCLFAGIRPQGEISRLAWSDLNFERREIYIRPDVSKTGDERFIEMSDNLVEWLLLHRKVNGSVDAPRAAIENVRTESGVRWEPDCMRHTFGSYHMAQFENAGKTALQMGHREIDTTFEHYRRAVRKEDAARFWAVRPQLAAKVIHPTTKSGAA